jgi:hypothetical protein
MTKDSQMLDGLTCLAFQASFEWMDWAKETDWRMLGGPAYLAFQASLYWMDWAKETDWAMPLGLASCDLHVEQERCSY